MQSRLTPFQTQKPAIGMIHLPALPGYQAHPGIDAVLKKAKKDLSALTQAGFDGALVENDNDQPHHIHVTKQVEQAFIVIMKELCSCSRIPVGMEIIYDMEKTIEVATRIGVPFVRLDVFADSVVTKWGTVPSPLLRINSYLSGDHPYILADVQVKHAKLVEQHKKLSASIADTIKGGADGIIITGTWTGIAPDLRDLQIAKTIVKRFKIPVFIGSGATKENISCFTPYIDGVIVGTSIKTGASIDDKKAACFIDAFHRSNSRMFLL